MANKSNKEVDPQGVKNVEETLSKTEQFLEKNYKTLVICLGVIVAIVGLFWLAKIHANKRQAEAESEMFQAEMYFESDSLELALNGDGNYLGFLDIVDKYGKTNSGNLAKYYSGICYLHLGEYEDAITYLQKYKKKDDIIAPLSIGAIGDAYVELGEMEKGISKYIEAAKYSDNNFSAPLFWLKAGQMYELIGKYNDALSAYQQISDNYPTSSEASDISKYIARVKVLMQ